MQNWKARIAVQPEVLVGKPVIKGTRISLELIMDRLEDGWTRKEIIESYPRIMEEDILAAIAFTAELRRE